MGIFQQIWDFYCTLIFVTIRLKCNKILILVKKFSEPDFSSNQPIWFTMSCDSILIANDPYGLIQDPKTSDYMIIMEVVWEKVCQIYLRFNEGVLWKNFVIFVQKSFN